MSTSGGTEGEDHRTDLSIHSSRPAQIRPYHLQRLAIIYVRQSSIEQVRDRTGSTAAQRELIELPRRWGWPDSLIRIIDSDLGLSATSTDDRAGFQELLGLIDSGKVGIVVVRDVSRLSRDPLDAARFIKSAQRARVLLEAGGHLYDAGTDNVSEMFGLQLQGLLSWFDNASRVRLMTTARIAKAKHGEAVSGPPTGYVRSGRGMWIKDPDLRVQEMITQVFELYPRLGSLSNVTKHLQGQALLFPRRRSGEVKWRPLTINHLYSVLTNPAYAGDYVYRRSRATASLDPHARRERRPQSEWIVTRDHHAPYVTHADWERVQALLGAHRPAMRPMVGKGHALLQGVLRCGVCQRRMHTKYWGRSGHARTGSYRCFPRNTEAQPHRIVVPALLVDHAVVHEVLKALTPVTMEPALEVFETARGEQTTIERQRARRLEDAEHTAEQARQAFIKTNPQNRRVRADLEARYEAALANLETIKTELATKTSSPVTLTLDDQIELLELAQHTRELWAAATTTNEDRKRLLGTVLSEIIVRDDSRETIELDVIWSGGMRQAISVLRPRGLDAVIDANASAGMTTDAIVDRLNAAGVVTARGRRITPNLVHQKLGHVGRRLKHERQLARQIIRQGVIDKTCRPDIIRQLNEQAPRLGPWNPQRLSDEIRHLRKGVLGIEPLPAVLPAELEKDEVLEIVERGLAAFENWKTIAARLNEGGLRPPRGSAFTPVQVRLLYMRSNGLSSFTLPAQPSVDRGERDDRSSKRSADRKTSPEDNANDPV